MNTKHVIAKANELNEGEMKQVELGDKKILLIRADGDYHAYHGECPHHGAPLAEGVACEGHIRCPWHHSTFDAVTGKMIDPPALDNLAPLRVEIVGDNVVLMLPKEPAKSEEPEMASGEEPAREEGDYVSEEQGPANVARHGQKYVVIGSGAAGTLAVETLRRRGFRGSLIMLTADSELPYDRTELSKKYLSMDDPYDPHLRSKDFYTEHDIDVRTSTVVENVDFDEKTVACSDGSQVKYDRLLIASGARPRQLDVPGAELNNVFTLRTFDDGNTIRDASEQADRAVVVGASFIAMEVASSLTQRGLDVTVVAPENVPFQEKLGNSVGKALQKLHEENGVTFHLGRHVDHFEGLKGEVQYVFTDVGERIETDMVVIGIGVDPVTDFVDVDPAEDGGIPVDEYLRLREDVFVAGDAASFIDWRNKLPIRIEHWRVAQQLGQLAAENMLDRQIPYHEAPFFWTMHHKTRLEYVGHCRKWDSVEIEGDLDDRTFIAYYLKDRHVYAAAGCGKSREMCKIAEVLRSEGPMTVEDLQRAPAGKNISTT
ncbi:MAG: FAD-dependent oxidoreductase [Phycisphaerae bacterium]